MSERRIVQDPIIKYATQIGCMEYGIWGQTPKLTFRKRVVFTERDKKSH